MCVLHSRVQLIRRLLALWLMAEFRMMNQRWL